MHVNPIATLQLPGLNPSAAYYVSGAVSVTVPPFSYECSQVVSAVGVKPSNLVLLSVAPHADSDENSETMLDVSAMSAAAGTNQITVTMGFLTPTAGLVRLNFLAV